MSANRVLLDGRYATGFYAGREVVSWPFLVNNDRVAQIITREFRVRKAFYQPPTPGVLRDPVFPSAYLMEEGAPQPLIGDALRISRTFATVPADQITYGSRVITKPEASTLGSLLTATLYQDSTLGVDLGSVYSYIGYGFTATNQVYTLKSSTSANSGGDTVVTSTAHGVVGTETLICRRTSGDYVMFASGTYTVVDANNIQLTGVNYHTNVTTFGVYLRAYTPGTDRVGVRFTQKFYLPGVTPTITTAADIPLPTLLLNDDELLSSVVANLTGYQTYDASELERWNGWPIYTQTLQEIDMATV